MHAEEEIMKDPEHLSDLPQQFCTEVVPWYYKNNADAKQETFSPQSTDGNVFIPALWVPETLIACSEKGYTSKAMRLPASWGEPKRVKVKRITAEGLQPEVTVPVKNHAIELTLKAREVVAVQK